VQVGQESVVHGIEAFWGQELPGIIQVAIPYVGMSLVRERGDVGDGDRPLVCVALCGFACKPELQRAIQKRLQV
jgi:hypothetical protein